MADSTKGSKGKTSTKTNRWKWDESKTERLLDELLSYKRQKLGEGLEWDSDKVVLFEHARKALAHQWPEDFGFRENSSPEKAVEEMDVKEYREYSEKLKSEKEMISIGYRRVANRFKTLKKSYTQDCQNDLRSGSGQLVAKFWHSCHELWGGSASTKPLEFGESSMSLNERQAPSQYEESEEQESSASISEESTSPSTTEIEEPEKRVKSVKTFVDCKRKKLQKQLTKEGKQDLVLQNCQRQMELQQSMLEVMQKKDEGLDNALKSIAESTAMLNKTLAVSMQYMMTMGQQQHVPYNHFMFQQDSPEFRGMQGQLSSLPTQAQESANLPYIDYNGYQN